MQLHKSLKTWNSELFAQTLQDELRMVERSQLPLQQALCVSSYVSDSEIDVMILHCDETADVIRVKTAIMYSGIIAGSCCADDPTPLCEQPESCELLIEINKNTAQATLTLL